MTAAEKATPRYAHRKSGLKVLRTIAVPEMVGAVLDEGLLNAVIQEQYAKRFNYRFQREIGLIR